MTGERLGLYTKAMQAIILDFYGVIFDPNTRSPMVGLVDFLQLTKQKNIPCAIASSSDSRSIQDYLAEHHLTEYFQVVIGGDKVMALKPNPECYVSAAEYFQLKPADCVVIDDTLAPLENAKQLGFQTIQFVYPENEFSTIIKTLWVSHSA